MSHPKWPDYFGRFVFGDSWSSVAGDTGDTGTRGNSGGEDCF